jgi:hypothetical protein
MIRRRCRGQVAASTCWCTGPTSLEMNAFARPTVAVAFGALIVCGKDWIEG